VANRDNHYEAAFEGFLRSRQIPYIAVDEAKRSLMAEGSLKSLDFIISRRQGTSWLVDVKGRRFPSGDQQHQYWKNWSTRDDLRSLAAWERLFGVGFQGLFVFAYNIVGSRSPVAAAQLYEFRGSLYGFIGIRLADYVSNARPISAAWDTLAMPTGEFRNRAAPLDLFLAPDAACPVAG